MSKRFEVVEYSSFYAVRDTETGEERCMGDGVDTIFDKNDKAYLAGTPELLKAWTECLNANPAETYEAYFGKQ